MESVQLRNQTGGRRVIVPRYCVGYAGEARMRPSRCCSRCLFWTDVRVYGQGDKEPGGSLVSWLLGCGAAPGGCDDMGATRPICVVVPISTREQVL